MSGTVPFKWVLLQSGMHFIFMLLFGLLFTATAFSNPPVEGGCVLGESQIVHGLSSEEAQARIRKYARLYVQNYASYKSQERAQGQKAYKYMELEEWTQKEVVGFTREQREFMYMSIGAELATGRVSTNQLPGYAAAIERKLFDIEVELDCEMLPE
ncbi:MAG: hypothetical protein GY727_13605 [Gammaproteobacteria bacterium]|nr:hypothetical protein [Gammaproteobacteria bacterium]MCP4088322.1 hypothetical protein [Gammaproteobacteria bacterium]MCP4276367.1 hypothetical protein [Gammaproteobacteria bacterium]MCP4831014.1 hypothetical protein [Gammaproteobacteria bacterium]MCP4927465.1 hypothetical protein [Gammaproteobacteria bacterium]